MDNATVGIVISLDLRLHPYDEAGVHSHVVVFGAADFVGQLNFGGGSMDVGSGQWDGRTAATDSGEGGVQ